MATLFVAAGFLAGAALTATAFAVTGVAALTGAGLATFLAVPSWASVSCCTTAVSSATRFDSFSISFLVGTPRLDRARATRSSNTCSRRSHVPAALPATAATFSSATLRVFFWMASPSLTSWSKTLLPFFWMDSPSLTRVSKTLLPSSCALAYAPKPASQICWAEPRMVWVTWFSERDLNFLTMVGLLSKLKSSGSGLSLPLDGV